ncbi:MAG: hypothetical protein K2X32_14475 [Phycisphaerales bacterium]|nr:hypothetical protein [Phycisphaerales bacterium]
MPPDPPIPPATSDDGRSRSVWTEAPFIAFFAEGLKLALATIIAVALLGGTSFWSASFLSASFSLGLALIAVIFGLVTARSLYRGIGLYRASRRIKSFKCPHCGYDVASLSIAGTCPECGGRFDLSPSEWDRLTLEVERRLRERDAKKPE